MKITANRKSILSFILIVLMLLPSLVFADSERVATITEANPIQTNVQNKLFIWEDNTFLFYCNGVSMVYKWKTSGSQNWSDPIIVTSTSDGRHFSLWLEECLGVAYIHYARTKYTMNDENVYYRKGKLHTDGSISWLAFEQTIVWHVVLNGLILEPYISVDSKGYPLIVACFQNDASNYWNTTVRRSSKKDGTWSTDISKSWLHTGAPGLEHAWIANTVVPLQTRSFMTFSVRGDSTNKAYYYNGTDFESVTSGIIESLIGTLNLYDTDHPYKWSAVAEKGNDVIHVIYTRKTTYTHFAHRFWNTSGWYDVIQPPGTAGHYNFSDAVRPRGCLDYASNYIRCAWLEYPDANKVYYMDWNCTWWTNPSVWLEETDNIIEHEDFVSAYSCEDRYAFSYLTESSRHIMFLADPPFPPFSEPPDIPHEPPWDVYIEIGMGFGGLGILIFLPFFLAIMFKDKKKDRWDWVIYAFMLFIIAIGLIIGWLWG